MQDIKHKKVSSSFDYQKHSESNEIELKITDLNKNLIGQETSYYKIISSEPTNNNELDYRVTPLNRKP
jgi:hypothetical protein